MVSVISLSGLIRGRIGVIKLRFLSQVALAENNFIKYTTHV